MKKNIRMAGILVALCISIQAQPVYAEQNTEVIDQALEVPEVSETDEEVCLTEETQNGSDETLSSDAESVLQDSELSNADSEVEENDLMEEEDLSEEDDSTNEQVEKAPLPKAVKGLHTTCKSSTSVLIEWKESKGAKKYIVYRKQGTHAYKKLKTVKRAGYIDRTIKYGVNYCYKIVPLNKDNKAGKSGTIKLNNEQAVNINTQKYSYAQMEKDMKELCAQYSNYCQMQSIGKTVDGRDIYDFVIGNVNAEKALLVVSTLHAREYICSAVMMKEIQYYLSNYNQSLDEVIPAKVLNNKCIHYIVMANPDGVMISQTQNSRWKANGRGVDLNRNFPAKKFDVGGKRGAEGYTGAKALSEPESSAVAKLTQDLKKQNRLCGVINYHAMGNIIYGQCSNEKISKDTNAMYQIARKQTGYKWANDSGRKIPGGQYREYVMYMLQIPSITIEIGSSAAPCPYWQYETEFQKNKMVALKIAKAL